MVTIVKKVRRIKYNATILNVFQHIYGIGQTRARHLILRNGGRIDLRVGSFKRDHFSATTERIYREDVQIQESLSYVRRINIKRIKKIKCRRGIRLALYLPSHGQRTKSNGISARFILSKTFEYIPKEPDTQVKKISSYVKRTDIIKKKSEIIYQRLLRRSFNRYIITADRRDLKQFQRQGKIGVFAKFIPKKKKKNK